MKTLKVFGILLSCFVISTSLNAQTCADAKAIATNVVCVDDAIGSHLAFDLEVTLDGKPVSGFYSGGIRFFEEDTFLALRFYQKMPTRINFPDGTGCPDLNNVEVRDYYINNPQVFCGSETEAVNIQVIEPIPTMGQWGLFILGLLFSTFALIYIRINGLIGANA